MKKEKRRNKDSADRKLFLAYKSQDFNYVEAYKSLRTNLKFVSVNKECKKIAVTSAIPGEGKSNVAVNLAVSLAEDGHKVMLVDCDLRKPVLHKYLKIKMRNNGLSNILNNSISIKEATTDFDDLSISVICAGVIPPNPAELLASDKMKEFIDAIEAEYDYIIFDTPPVAVVTDAAVLSRYVDGILLVIRQKHVKKDSAKLALNNLNAVNANVIGAVLNDFDIKETRKASGYYYSYEYNYGN